MAVIAIARMDMTAAQPSCNRMNAAMNGIGFALTFAGAFASRFYFGCKALLNN